MAKKIFKTTIEDNEIIKEIISCFTINDLENLIENDILLKHICNIKKNKITNSKEEIKSHIIKVIKNNYSIKQKILDIWDLNRDTKDYIKKIKKENRFLIKNILENYEDKLLDISSFLWRCNSVEDNRFADELYKIYITKKQKNEEVGCDFMEENKELLSMTLQDFIERIIKYDNDLELKDCIINEQKETIKKLEKKINNLTIIKKDISQLNKKFIEIENNNKLIYKQIEEYITCMKNDDLKQLIQEQNKELKKINLRKGLKDINENNNNMLLNFERSIIKCLDETLKNHEKKISDMMEDKVNYILNSIKTKKSEEISTVKTSDKKNELEIALEETFGRI